MLQWAMLLLHRISDTGRRYRLLGMGYKLYAVAGCHLLVLYPGFIFSIHNWTEALPDSAADPECSRIIVPRPTISTFVLIAAEIEGYGSESIVSASGPLCSFRPGLSVQTAVPEAQLQLMLPAALSMPQQAEEEQRAASVAHGLQSGSHGLQSSYAKVSSVTHRAFFAAWPGHSGLPQIRLCIQHRAVAVEEVEALRQLRRSGKLMGLSSGLPGL